MTAKLRTNLLKLNPPELLYSFIIPCFNRADEVEELLNSFITIQIPPDAKLEIFLVDGSPTEILKPVIEPFATSLDVKHLHRPSLPISPSRNLGAQLALGEYLIFLDSDVILPVDYLAHVDLFLQKTNADSFGGPDRAHESFTTNQKAISYAMTSFFTTGGIRGGRKHLHQYNPRGFNMGIRKSVFAALQGYSTMACGEDIELSIRVIKAGHKVLLNPDAYVYHKRRSTFKSFFRQVFRFGAARINIFYRHRNELKIVHLFPSIFVLFLVFGLLGSFISSLFAPVFLLVSGLYFGTILVHASIQSKSIGIGLLSVFASVLQLAGYGLGFMANAVAVFVMGHKDGMNLGSSK